LLTANQQDRFQWVEHWQHNGNGKHPQTTCGTE